MNSRIVYGGRKTLFVFIVIDCAPRILPPDVGRSSFAPNLVNGCIQMPATFSNESRIAAGLQTFGCSANEFCDLAKQRGIQISRGALSEAFNGKRVLDQNIAEKLLDLLDEMAGLQNAVTAAASKIPLVIDWSETERITTALVLRRLAAIDSDQTFTEIANRATAAVTQ